MGIRAILPAHREASLFKLFLVQANGRFDLHLGIVPP